MIRKVEIQRLTIVSSKPFEAVIAAVEKGIGRPDMSDFGKASSGAQTYAELENVVNRSVPVEPARLDSSPLDLSLRGRLRSRNTTAPA